MGINNRYYYTKIAWLLIIGSAVFRLFFAGLFPLSPDETNYWQWSRHLAWSYHDQAPMIAWLIRLSTWYLNHSEIAVRLPSVIAMTVATVYLFLIARRWLGESVGFKTVLLSQLILFFYLGGLLATPDGLQAAAWAGACYHVGRAYESGKSYQWLMGGIWFGFGMLSKYTMIVFLPCAFCYGLFSRVHRKRLLSIWPYIGVLCGLLMFWPVIQWNLNNNFNSFRHIAFIGGANDHFALHFKYFAEYLGSQAALLSPLVFLLVLSAWPLALIQPRSDHKWIYSYLFFTSFPMFLGFALLSIHTRVYGNWPGAGYLMASILTAAFFGVRAKEIFKKKSWGRILWPYALSTSFLISAVVLLQTAAPFLPIPVKLDRTATEITGWPELGKKARVYMDAMPDPQRTFLFGLRYQIASELAFYTPGQPETVSINKWNRPNVYDYWWKDENLIGFDAVGVSGNANLQQLLTQVFERVEPPEEMKIYRHYVTRDWRYFPTDLVEKPVKIYYFYRAYGFKGGLRWASPLKWDIRKSSDITPYTSS